MSVDQGDRIEKILRHPHQGIVCGNLRAVMLQLLHPRVTEQAVCCQPSSYIA